jgi:23S rRNA (uracil1939-C5)-methyltransferase
MQSEAIRLTIDSLSSDGSGVARLDGKTVFVEEGIPGDTAEALITVDKKNYAVAKIKKLIEPSKDRIAPPCKYYNLCGACQLQHIAYPAQLRYKTQIVKDAVRKIAGFSPEIVHEIIGAEQIWGYRNKMQYPVRLRRKILNPKYEILSKFENTNSKYQNDVNIGYYKKGTHEVIDIDECPVLHPFLNKIASTVRKVIKDFKVPVYDEDNGRGLLRHILARIGFKTKEALLCFIINGDELKGSKNIANAVIDELNQIEKSFKLRGVVKNSNKRQTNVILGEKTSKLWGEDHIEEKLGDLRFNISASSFFQINPAQTEKLYNTVRELAGLSGKESVMDIYCGTGSISLWIAKDAKEIYGIEEVESAVEDAKANAKLNNIKNAFFKCGKAEKAINLYQEAGFKPDIVILDPPRSGCSEIVLSAVKKLAPKKIINVSCDPATLSRDLKILSDKYITKRIQPVDMFPQTSHIECVAEAANK